MIREHLSWADGTKKCFRSCCSDNFQRQLQTTTLTRVDILMQYEDREGNLGLGNRDYRNETRKQALKISCPNSLLETRKLRKWNSEMKDLSRRTINCQMTLPRTDSENPCQILPATTTEHCILWNFAPGSKQAEDNSQILSGGNMSQYFDRWSSSPTCWWHPFTNNEVSIDHYFLKYMYICDVSTVLISLLTHTWGLQCKS